MTRILLGLAGVVLLAVTALGLIWLVGQLLLGAGAFAVGTAGVLLRLLWFVVVAGLLGGAVYFVANAWRPGLRVTGPQSPLQQPRLQRVLQPPEVVGAAQNPSDPAKTPEEQHAES